MTRLALVLTACALLWASAAAQDPPAAATDRSRMEAQAGTGDLNAAYMLGRMYLDGVGGEKNEATARTWLARAAKGGHVRASVLLGLMLMAGQGGKPDRDAARPLLLYAAAAQDDDALYAMGVLFAEGTVREAGGPAQNAAGAVFWFRAAALRGNVDGMYNAGLMYLRGLGTARDLAEAYRWFVKAAEAGEAEAQILVAQMLSEGQGVPVDAKAALVWYYRAKANGTVNDELELSLVRKLTPEEVADAKRLAGEAPASPPQTR